MSRPMLDIKNLSKSFGALQATENVSLTVNEGTIHALIGPNGAGKTTLISQISGYLTPDSGSITFDGRDLLALPAHKRPHAGLVRSFQITSVIPEFTVRDNVGLVLQSLDNQVFQVFAKAGSDQAERAKADAILERTGLADEADSRAENLAHGQKRQLEIAMALAADPKLLLLDEPMAGMGVEESRNLTTLLTSLRGTTTMLLVEHDMDVVFSLADRISVLVYGKIIATDTPQAIRANRDVQEAYLGTHELHQEDSA
ncbi:ABC transporter ATP-binding protein [uncultured Boseongicola sp.]|uniref:ABC transporter ATP-binding protein n=1 Tax=uncultured Boseongicola sp. TaxID=1648499 RepID=UPI002629299F|nr:ABC transporter ATP-binding protein [uncultured Boseongicola sp.]